MEFRFLHCNLNVLDLDRSITFYEQALGLHRARRSTSPDGRFIIQFLEDGSTGFQLELTWLRDHTEPYDLGDNESHIAFAAADFEAAHALHSRMGCICFENPAMGIYFIEDPDGYWLEIIPQR